MKKGITATCASAILFGITPLLTTFIYSFGINTMTTVFYRSVFAVALSAMICCYRHISFRISYQQLFHIAVAAVCGSGLTTILLFQSYTYIDTGSATGLHFLYPLFVALITRLLFKEKMGRHKAFALVLAFAAMMLFLQDQKSTHTIGYGLAIASALSYAFYMIYCEKQKLTHIEPFLLSFYLALFIALETLVYHLFQPQLQFVLPLPAYGLLILLALCSALFAVILLQIGIRLLSSSTAALYCLLEPITSLIVGILFLNEAVNLSKMIAVVLIMIALALLSCSPIPKSADAKQNKA